MGIVRCWDNPSSRLVVFAKPFMGLCGQLAGGRNFFFSLIIVGLPVFNGSDLFLMVNKILLAPLKLCTAVTAAAALLNERFCSGFKV